MSGIKYATIALNDAIKAQLSRDNAKNKYEKNLKILYEMKVDFESKYGKKLYQVDKDVEKIIGKMRNKFSSKLDERNDDPYKDYTYEQGILEHEKMDIDNATNEIYNIQRKVAEFGKIMLDLEKETAHQVTIVIRIAKLKQLL
jgi:predicted transcriptional regulator